MAEPIALTKGANTALGPAHEDGLAGVLVGVSWDTSLDTDVCTLVCGSDRRVLSDDHFVFYNNLQTPDRTLHLRYQETYDDRSRDRAQVLTSLADLPAAVDRVVVSLSTVAPGADLRPVRDLMVRVVDLRTGGVLASYAVEPGDLGEVSCLVLMELYRHQGGWKVRAIGQGYANGLEGLATSHGVSIDG